MKYKMSRRWMSFVLVAGFLAIMGGCSGSSGGGSGVPGPNPSVSAFDKFKDSAEFGEYIQWVQSEKESSGNSSGSGEGNASPDSEGAAGPVANAPSQVETNNQSENVDEGDIIKFAGDRLVVLRDQHLIVLDIGGEHKNNPVILDDKELDADFGSDNWGKGAWYDEMLVFNSHIVLIAYRFHAKIADVPVNSYTGAIEILNFSLNGNGSLGDGSRVFIESSDYYSGSTNYATRKIGNGLVVYSPFYAIKYVTDGDTYRTEPRIPYVLELVDASQKLFRRVRPAIDYAEIFRGSPESSGHFLHAVYAFDVDGDINAFDSSGVMGDYSNVYYVTDEHLYLNISRWWFDGAMDAGRDKSTLYQFKIGEDARLKNMAEISGRVTERFAMQEEDERIQFVALEMSSGASSAVVHASSLDRGSFGDLKESSIAVDTRWLLSVRFNGDFAVIAPYNYGGEGLLYLADFTGSWPAVRGTSLPASGIFMMQPYLENRWIALGETSGHYYDTSIDVSILEVSSGGALSEVVSSSIGSGFVWSDAFWNDHAFFMDAENNLFGFPYSSWGVSNNYWEDGVVYFSIANDALTQLGNGIIQTGDSCGECWYGNSRVVMRDNVYYNLLGRQLKVSNLDRALGNMVEVSDLQLLEPVRYW